MREWLSAIARLAATAEGEVDRLRYRFADRLDRDRAYIAGYRGYGTSRSLWVSGRVLRNPPPAPTGAEQSAWENLLATYRRFESDEVPGARVRLRAGGMEREVFTNEEGYFSAELPLRDALAGSGEWHEVAADLIHPEQGGPPAVAIIPTLVPPTTAVLGVISDIDDTVLRTDVTQILRMARHMFFGNARTRLPFPGVAAFYRALACGVGGARTNPIFYVSSSPWNLYDLLEDFLDVHGVPAGPLFLKDWGRRTIRDHEKHKLGTIRTLLATYPALPFVLIGDSGEKDPEIYRRIVLEHPGRIRAIYIRDVTTKERDVAVHAIAAELRTIGVEMLLTTSTAEAAEHAARTGLIAPDAASAPDA